MTSDNQVTNHVTKYLYDGAGNRVYSDVNGILTAYVRDAQGNTLGVYDMNSEGNPFWWPVLTETYIYGSNRIGVDRTIRNNQLSFFDNERNKDLTTTRYELTNHLGNVLTTVTGRKLGQEGEVPGEVGYYLPEFVSATDYYPFGQPMPGRQYPSSSGTNGYRYGFNGKELDSDGEFGSLTHYDYGFRIYNPAIGKFLSVDPLTASYPWYTPYQFAGNSPIQAIDIDGLEKGFVQRHDVIIDEKGNFITKSVGKPILVTENGDWSGYKTTNKFSHKGKDYYNQGDIPGWSDFRTKHQAQVNRQAKNVALIVGGIVTVATFIPSGGQSASIYSQMVAGFGITSGIYSASSGVAKFSLEMTNNPEISNKIPNGLLNATVGLAIKSQFEDKEVIETIDALLSITEGYLTFNKAPTTDLKKWDNFLNILNNSESGYNLVMKINENLSECNEQCDR